MLFSCRRHSPRGHELISTQDKAIRDYVSPPTIKVFTAACAADVLQCCCTVVSIHRTHDRLVITEGTYKT
jgi:hypothetical protein